MANLALIEAVKRDDMEAVERLLSGGANVNEQDEHGWTPLMWTAGRGDAKAVSFLLERGGDVTIAGSDGRTALMIAKSAGHRQVAASLAEAEKERGVWQDPRATCAYCKAYHLRDLRRFEGWSEAPSGGAERAGGDIPESSDAAPLTDEHVVYLHQDFTVTRSMWHGEGVIFDKVTPQWRMFCEATLAFAIAEDLF